MTAQPFHDRPFLRLVPPIAPALTVTHRDQGPVWVVGLVGEADLASREDLDRGLSYALARNRGVVVVDVSQLEFCDTRSATSVLEASWQAPGTEMVLTGSHGIVRRVFDLLDPAQTLARHE